MFYDQEEYSIRFAWGREGLQALAPAADAVVIVDVLSFSTCVDIAVSNGAEVYPIAERGQAAAGYACELGAELAGGRGRSGVKYTLSPESLRDIPPHTKLVLPSPNGATLSSMSPCEATFAGCLRNCEAVARAAERQGRIIAVVAAGERWPETDTLRPAMEDLIGAGAIISYLRATKSPEARTAEAVFDAFADTLGSVLLKCISGQELAERGFGSDIAMAADLNVSNTAPCLHGNAYAGGIPRSADIWDRL